MKRRLGFTLGCLLLLIAASQATERVKNLYKATKLSVGDVIVSCTDGGKPAVHQLENAPAVIISCPVGQ